MAAFGSSYPGVNQPAWWYANTYTSASTTTLYPYVQVSTTPEPEAAAKPSKPKTAVEWLRGRVGEMCDYAGLVHA